MCYMGERFCGLRLRSLGHFVNNVSIYITSVLYGRISRGCIVTSLFGYDWRDCYRGISYGRRGARYTIWRCGFTY